jgi:hypothetical protein
LLRRANNLTETGADGRVLIVNESRSFCHCLLTTKLVLSFNVTGKNDTEGAIDGIFEGVVVEAQDGTNEGNTVGEIDGL